MLCNQKLIKSLYSLKCVPSAQLNYVERKINKKITEDHGDTEQVEKFCIGILGWIKDYKVLYDECALKTP